MFPCSRLLISIYFFSLLLANKLEGLQERFDLLDFQVSNVCHLFLNDTASFIFCVLLSGMFSTNQELCTENIGNNFLHEAEVLKHKILANIYANSEWKI